MCKKSSSPDFQSTPYFKLLTYAYERFVNNEEFTRDEACSQGASGVNERQFDDLIENICPPPTLKEINGKQEPVYGLGLSGFLNYMNFRGLLEARSAAKKADSRAFWAQTTAAAALLLSLAGAISNYVSPPVVVADLEPAQLTKIEAAINSSKINQDQFDKIIGTIQSLKPPGGAAGGEKPLVSNK